MAAIRSEGGLLPADVLARIAELDRDLGGLSVADYHLAPNERLGEAIARSWARLTAAWDAFSEERDLLQPGDHASKATRERWLLPLFSELGYGRLVQQPGVEIDGKSYPVFCEYNHSPLHLVGAGVPLDRRTAGVRGAAEQSPHSLVQELLNRSTSRLWGIVTNGLSLRLLRDNVTLTRQAYVEFDLEAILATEAYEDFALLWLSAHQSRIEAEIPEDCWLELWTQAGQRDGARALGELRAGVERAIGVLGVGFLSEPSNSAIQTGLRDGTFDGQAMYRELLRLVYRLLFLFVAEDRDALLLPDDGTMTRREARSRYDAFYSTRRFRVLAGRRRGGKAHDLYEQVKLLWEWLLDTGQHALALPPLGSAMWDPSSTEHLASARLTNGAFLNAIRELAYVEDGRRPVDFRNLGAEELGSVYESLLELQPTIDREVAGFRIGVGTGHERRSTGSYYTPVPVTTSVLDAALVPLLDAAVATADPEAALLALRICDPACGSGHFLIAAAARIAKRLASVREGDSEPAPAATRQAMRDVIAHCVYGVDANPMAVELCRFNLWLAALDNQRAAPFLDDQVRHGDALVGLAFRPIPDSVPESAFKAVGADEKAIVKALKRRNAIEMSGQLAMSADAISTASADLDDLDDGSVRGYRSSERALQRREAAIAPQVAAANCWVAAFLTPKDGSVPVPTTQAVRASLAGALGLDEQVTASAIAREHRVFHWALEFPAVSARGGFDLVVGNPPWIAHAGRAAMPMEDHRRHYLEVENAAFAGYRSTHGAFVGRCIELVRPRGRLAFVLPTSVADLSGYAPVRRAHDALARVQEPLTDLGEGVFEGVNQPSMVLVSQRVATALSVDATETREWELERSDLGQAATDLLQRLKAMITLPPELFAERGIQSTGAADLLSATPSARHSLPVLQGGDIVEFTTKEPSHYIDASAIEDRFKRPQQWASVAIYLRQTARYPIAAPATGEAFRNSLLAVLQHDEWDTNVLLGILNSRVIRWYHYQRFRDARQGMPQVKIGHLRQIPAPPRATDAALSALEDLVARLVRDVDRQGPVREELEAAIFELYGISTDERAVIDEWWATADRAGTAPVDPSATSHRANSSTRTRTESTTAGATRVRVCASCGAQFTTPPRRGRPPTRCEACR